MPLSPDYKKLKVRIGELEKRFLKFEQIDSSKPENQDKLRAFKLLIHAEIESYIENVVLEIWNQCSDDWKNRKKVLPSLAFLIMYSSSRFEANEKQITKDDRIAQILNSYENIVKDNHGIMRKNILKLVIPLGLKYDDLDETWLTIIDSYGNYRGLVAHKSSSAQIQIDKENESNTIKLILKGLKKLDLKLQRLNATLKMPF